MYIVTPGKDAYIMTIAFGSQKPHMYLTEECIEYLRAREWIDALPTYVQALRIPENVETLP